MQPGSSNARDELRAALLAYQREPAGSGPAPMAPRLPFARIRDVLQLAGGRSTHGDPQLRQAACFFIRSALLRPEADHYALLGLERCADTAAIKDHYRLMMRLLHPDFAAASPVPWPADAASRVNLAYESLSAPALRRAYDEKCAEASPSRQQGRLARGAATRGPAAKPATRHPRRRLEQLAMLFGGAGALAVLLALLASGTTESLVQRPGWASAPAPLAPPPAAVAAEPPAIQPAAVVRAQPQVVVSAIATPAQPEPAPAPEPEPRAAVPSPPRADAVAVRPAAVAAAPAQEPAVPAPAPPAPVASANAQRVPPTPAATAAGPTLAEAHPVFSALLQQIESGWGDRVLGMLDRPARVAPAAQALLARYNAIVEERRPVRLSGIAFSSQARDGHLLMTGRVLIEARDEGRGQPPGELALEAEFASRDGKVVITRLAPRPE